MAYIRDAFTRVETSKRQERDKTRVRLERLERYGVMEEGLTYSNKRTRETRGS